MRPDWVTLTVWKKCTWGLTEWHWQCERSVHEAWLSDTALCELSVCPCPGYRAQGRSHHPALRIPNLQWASSPPATEEFTQLQLVCQNPSTSYSFSNHPAYRIPHPVRAVWSSSPKPDFLNVNFLWRHHFERYFFSPKLNMLKTRKVLLSWAKMWKNGKTISDTHNFNLTGPLVGWLYKSGCGTSISLCICMSAPHVFCLGGCPNNPIFMYEWETN